MMRRTTACLLLLLGLTACGSGERPSPAESDQAVPDAIGGDERPSSKSFDDAGHEALPVPVCAEGTQRSCNVTLPSHGPVNNCFVGAELCIDGDWGPCDTDLEAE